MTNPLADVPLVTVLVPVKDGAPWITESLDSILGQTWPRLEVIVLDDASSDATPAILAGFGERIRVHRNPVNLGIYENVNSGLRLAHGAFIAVYHADDVYLPTIVEEEARFLQRHPEVGGVFCLDLWIDARGREYGRLDVTGIVTLDQPIDEREVLNGILRRKNAFFVCPTAMLRADAYRDLGGYRSAEWRNNADLDLWLRLARRGPVAVLSRHLMKYRHFHGNSSSRYHHLRTDPERFFAIVDHHLDQGGQVLAAAQPLRDYEAHRCEDRIMIAIARYILGDLVAARESLDRAHCSTLLRSQEVQRFRLCVLLIVLSILCRLPRSAALAKVFERRWHGTPGVSG